MHSSRRFTIHVRLLLCCLITVAANNANAAPAHRIADMYDLSDMGARLDGGIDDESRILAAYDAVPDNATLILPCGKWPGMRNRSGYPWAPHIAGKTVAWEDICGLSLGNTTQPLDLALGDGDLYIRNLAGGRWFRRTDFSGGSEHPTVSIGYSNYSADNRWAWGNVFPDKPNLEVYTINGTHDPANRNVNGSVVGINDVMDSYGDNTWSTQDQGLKIKANKYGQSSTWALVSELNDYTGLPPRSWAQTNELDINANGADTPESLYDPKQSDRKLLYLSAGPHGFDQYVAGKDYDVGNRVINVDRSGIAAIYICTRSGKTGFRKLEFPDQIHGLVTDGTVVWMRGADYRVGIGVGIWANRDNNDQNVSFNTFLSGNIVVRNAFIDTTQISLTERNSAVIRLAANQIIDFSAEGTNESKNHHTLQFSNYMGHNQLAYQVKGTTEFSVDDNGNTWSDGILMSGKGLRLASMTRQQILNIRDPQEGMEINDSDDHVPVIFENGHWYPIVLGKYIE